MHFTHSDGFLFKHWKYQSIPDNWLSELYMNSEIILSKMLTSWIEEGGVDLVGQFVGIFLNSVVKLNFFFLSMRKEKCFIISVTASQCLPHILCEGYAEYFLSKMTHEDFLF